MPWRSLASNQRSAFRGCPGSARRSSPLPWPRTWTSRGIPGGVFWLTLGRTPDDVVVWQGKLAAAVAGRPVEIRTAREGKTGPWASVRREPSFPPHPGRRLECPGCRPRSTPLRSRVDCSSPPRNREVAKGLGAAIRELQELRTSDALRMLAAYAGRRVDALPELPRGSYTSAASSPSPWRWRAPCLQDRPDDQWPILLGQLAKGRTSRTIEVALPQYPPASEHAGRHRGCRHRSCPRTSGATDPRLCRVQPGTPRCRSAFLQRLWGRRWRRSCRGPAHGEQAGGIARSSRATRRGRLTLHDLQHDYVRARAGDLAARHARLVRRTGTPRPPRPSCRRRRRVLLRIHHQARP